MNVVYGYPSTGHSLHFAHSQGGREGEEVCNAAAAAPEPSKVYDPRRTARQTARPTDRDRRNDHKATAKVTHARTGFHQILQ